MTLWEWFQDPANWSGPTGVPARLVEQFIITGIAVAIAAAIALPAGIATGHSGRWGATVTNVANLGRAIPTFALLLLFASISAIGVGLPAAVLALTLFALPPMLTNANVAIATVDPGVRRSARAMGLTGTQQLWWAEIPLGMPLIFAGIRTAVVQTTATATLAAFVGGGGLGRFILDGFGRQDQTMVLAGVVLVAVVTMSMEGILAGTAVPAVATSRARGCGSTRLGDLRSLRGSPLGSERAKGLFRTVCKNAPMRRLASIASIAAAGLLLAACSSGSSSSSEPVTIGAFNFSESTILAEIYAQALSAKGIEASVTQSTNREVLEPALEAGEVQIVPEYLGTFTEFLNLKVNGPDAAAVASGDVDATFAEAQKLAEPLGVTVLTPSPAADQNAFAVTAEFASANNLVTVSDLAALSQTQSVRLGGPPECPERPFCQPGLEGTYGFKTGEFVPLDAGGPLTKEALAQGSIDVGLVFSSDGGVAANDLVVLEDDKALQQVDNVVPVVKTSALTSEISDVLDQVSAALTTSALVAMNKAVDIDRQKAAEVAAQFLTDNGLS